MIFTLFRSTFFCQYKYKQLKELWLMGINAEGRMNKNLQILILYYSFNM